MKIKPPASPAARPVPAQNVEQTEKAPIAETTPTRAGEPGAVFDPSPGTRSATLPSTRPAGGPGVLAVQTGDAEVALRVAEGVRGGFAGARARVAELSDLSLRGLLSPALAQELEVLTRFLGGEDDVEARQAEIGKLRTAGLLSPEAARTLDAELSLLETPARVYRAAERRVSEIDRVRVVGLLSPVASVALEAERAALTALRGGDAKLEARRAEIEDLQRAALVAPLTAEALALEAKLLDALDGGAKGLGAAIQELESRVASALLSPAELEKAEAHLATLGSLFALFSPEVSS